MNVLFLGGVFDSIAENGILEKSKGTVHYAANKYQWNLIDGLLGIDNLKLEILSAPFVGSFPKDYKEIQYVGRKSIYNNTVETNFVSFNNVWGYRSISRKNNLQRSIKVFAENPADNKVIIVYSPHTPFLQAAVYAKEYDPSIHICLVVPDLPQFMNLKDKRSFIYDRLKKVDIDIFNNNLKYVDSFVLLTDPMKNMLNIGERPYIVIEGVVSTEVDNIDNQSAEFGYCNDITVVYTGTLNKKFGIVNLIHAFHNTSNRDAQLIICGRGDSEETIKKYAEKDKRIVFLGQLSNSEVTKIQQRATVLVNPRQNNEEFTKYSFPSKNMEYLLTGRPVIAYKLDGIPEDYNKCFYYVEDDSIESLTRKIEEILSMDEETRSEFGNKARSYVLNEKNNRIAAQKIINMIEKSRSR